MKQESIVTKAYQFAQVAHEGHLRKYTFEPYITHPVEVAAIVEYYFPGREEMVCAAFLHDVVEDTPMTIEIIIKEFGTIIGELVSDLTHIKLPENNRAENKRLTREKLAAATYEAKCIKLADLIHNIPSIKKYDPSFWKAKYKRETLQLIDTALYSAHPLMVERLLKLI